MAKNELLLQLENAKNNYVLILAACSLFSNDKSYSILDESHCKFAHYTVEFRQVANLMRKSHDRDIACKEFIKMGMRILVKESFELIKDYCNTSSQNKKFKEQSWYEFTRIIRNCLSHNFKFEFNKKDKSKLPVSWRNKQIDLNANNTFLKLSFFGYKEAWELFCDMCSFVKESLT